MAKAIIEKEKAEDFIKIIKMIFGKSWADKMRKDEGFSFITFRVPKKTTKGKKDMFSNLVESIKDPKQFKKLKSKKSWKSKSQKS